VVVRLFFKRRIVTWQFFMSTSDNRKSQTSLVLLVIVFFAL
jgi:hypothetical protein